MAHDLRDVGGTRGGFGMFVVGLGMTIAGLYLLFRQVDVHGGYFHWGSVGNDRSFGLTLLPLPCWCLMASVAASLPAIVV